MVPDLLMVPSIVLFSGYLIVSSGIHLEVYAGI
mgnify:CR=1 FL=1